MNKAIFITVRTGSSRLPQKALKDIEGVPAIVQLIRRVKRSRLSDMIVLCTTSLPEDDSVCRLAEQENSVYYRGSVQDKLDRWRGAAEKFDVEFFVTADGDDLLCEPELIDLAFSQYEREKPDFIEGRELACGAFTYGIKTDALRKVCDRKDTDDTEMMWVYFTQTGMFDVQPLKNVPKIFQRPDIRITLDYEEDLIFFRKIFAHFSGHEFTLRDAIAFLDENPQIIEINRHCQEMYLNNQKKRTHLTLKENAHNDG